MLWSSLDPGPAPILFLLTGSYGPFLPLPGGGIGAGPDQAVALAPVVSSGAGMLVDLWILAAPGGGGGGAL